MKKILFIILSLLLQISAYAQTDPDVIEFVFISDTHKYGPSADVRYADENIKKYVEYCQQNPSIKFALHGGDFMNAYDTNHKQALFCLERARQDFKGIGVPFYATKGNHDCNGKQRTADGRKDGTQIVTDHEFFQIFSPLSSTNPLADSTDVVYDKLNREGNYFYRDFPEQKFRMIVLNDYDRDSLEYFGYHEYQAKWIAEQALNFTDKENPEDWCFIMLGHGLSVNLYEHPINRIIHAYVRGELLEDSDHGVSYRADYHNQKRAKMVAFLAGHQHEDMYQRTEDYNMITMTRGFATGGEVESDPVSFSHYTLNVREKTLYEERIGRGRSKLYSYDPHQQLWPVESFSGAEGMGSLTQGGKNGRIITVTNLKDSGEGSLRWAVEQTGSRTIIFNVAGDINLKTPLVISNDSISILGQSAPGQGICLKGAPVKILASEVIMRYLHIRPGRQANGERVDAISDGEFGQHNVMLDHLSISYFNGHAVAFRRCMDVTVQYCIISHMLHNDTENTADEPAAVLAGGFMATYYKNLIANCANAMMFPNEEGQNRWIHVLRNMFYNWKDHAMYGGGRQGEITIEENYMQPGPATVDSLHILDVAEDGTGRYYVSWNFMKDREDLNGQNWKMVNDRDAMPYIPLDYDEAERAKMHPVQRPQRGTFGTTCTTIAAFHYKPVWSGKTAMAIYRDIMLTVGCSRIRDTYDTKLLDDVRDSKVYGSKNGLIRNTDKVLTWPVLKSAKEDRPVLTADNVIEWSEDRVKQEKSIVILFETSSMGHLEMYPRLEGYTNAISADTAHVAVVNGGDFLLGDVLATASRSKTIVDMMKYTHYDAFTLGNKDFSYPVADIKEIIKPLGQSITLCNLIDVKTKKPVFDPYIIKEYGSRKVAYIGLIDPEIMVKYSSALRDTQGKALYDIVDEGLAALLQKTVDDARKAGADYVIAMPHFDNEVGQDPVAVQRLIAQTRGIDIVLSYASRVINSKMTNLDGKKVFYSSPDQSLQSISKIIIANDGIITTENIPASKMLFKSSASTHMLDSINAQFDDFIDKKIADCTVAIKGLGEDGRYVLGYEYNGANLVADACYVADDNCDISFVNSGSIRANLNPGQITRRDLLKMVPYDNLLLKFRMKGSAIKELLDGVAKAHPNHMGGFLIPSGLRYTIHKGKYASDIEVLNKVKGAYEPLELEAYYTVICTDFNIKDKTYGNAFEDIQEVTELSIRYSEALMRYIEKDLNGHIGTLYSDIKHMISFAD